MPLLTRWLVKTSFIYLGLALITGLGLEIQSTFELGELGGLFPIHMEFLLIGWFAQLAMGAAFWIMPRFSRGQPRGNVSLIWMSFGVIISTLQLGSSFAILIGRIAEVGAGIVLPSDSGGVSSRMESDRTLCHYE